MTSNSIMMYMSFNDCFTIEILIDSVQCNELTRFLRDHKLSFEKQNEKQKKKFLAMA